jgi:PAS domain S-box-containing protein
MAPETKVNILMVDDQPGKLLSYEAILAELGENLLKASSARGALEQLLRNDVAVVLMDVSMPEIDGFELAEMIRQHPRYQRTAIIFISAVHLTDLDRLKGYQRGAVDYISVPVVPELLRAKVSVFAELHRKNRELEALNQDLEVRVVERTVEIERRTEALELLNSQLTRKNQELDAIMKTAPDIIFSSKSDGHSDYISGRFHEYTGGQSGLTNGTGILEYVHPEDLERSLAQWSRAIQKGENYESEYRLRSKTGEYRWFRARAVPIRDESGEVARWYGTCSDIHDSKLLEQSIRDNALELERMVEERTGQLRRLSGRLMTMQDEERRRIAREIHDGLGQELVAAKMVLEGVISKSSRSASRSAIMESRDLVDRAIQQVRTISHLLHPLLLDDVGLLSAITWYVEGLSKRSGIEIVLSVTPSSLPRYSPDLEMAVFRIIQEALTNVFRHSGARKATVSVNATAEQLSVTVNDDGCGVGEHVSKLRPGSIGIGIGGMTQRAKEFGGELRVKNSHPGTIVELIVPCHALVSEEAHASA